MNEADRPTATIDHATPLSAANPSPRDASPLSQMPRLARYIVTRGWIHVMLICGAGIFLFPFLWMLSTSLKTDEELPAAHVLPDVPRFRAISPYVREVDEPSRPAEAPEARWAAILPQLVQLGELAIQRIQRSAPTGSASSDSVDSQSRGDSTGGQAASGTRSTAGRSGDLAGNGNGPVDPQAHRQAAARWLVNRLVAKMNNKLWLGGDAALLDEFRRLLAADDSADARTALDQSLASLELISVQVRSLAAHILTEGHELIGGWTVESGPARIVDGPRAKRLEYDFSSSAGTPAILRYDFAVPADFRPEDLHKITIALKADDSWHQIDATLDWGAQRWQSQRTTYLAQHRPMSVIFQPPTFDDTTMRNRNWVSLRAVGPRLDGRSAPAATLRFILSPSTTLAANVGKAQRNYLRAFVSVPFWKYVFNSVLLVALTMGGALFSASFVAYAFARLHWPGRSVAFVILLATMMLPAQVTMIPSFMIWRTLGWYNTLNPMWVPAWFGSAFFIFLMTQHMRTIPRELEEAARIDGLNAVQTWWYIMLPQVKPVLAAIAIMTFMGAWNEFMGPLIYLRDQARFPLSLGLFGMRTEQTTVDWTMLMAGNMLMTLPVILVFFLFQRYFIQGMTMSGMKA